MGAVQWSAEQGQWLCQDWAEGNRGGHGFWSIWCFVCPRPQPLSVGMTKKYWMNLNLNFLQCFNSFLYLSENYVLQCINAKKKKRKATFSNFSFNRSFPTWTRWCQIEHIHSFKKLHVNASRRIWARIHQTGLGKYSTKAHWAALAKAKDR